MRKASIDLHPCLHLLVFIPHISTYTEENLTIGAVVGIPKLLRFAMANANGSSQDVAQSLSTSPRVAISNSATAK